MYIETILDKLFLQSNSAITLLALTITFTALSTIFYRKICNKPGILSVIAKSLFFPLITTVWVGAFFHLGSMLGVEYSSVAFTTFRIITYSILSIWMFYRILFRTAPIFLSPITHLFHPTTLQSLVQLGFFLGTLGIIFAALYSKIFQKNVGLQWLSHLLLPIGVALIFQFVFKLVSQRTISFLKKRKYYWIQELFNVVSKPLILFVWYQSICASLIVVLKQRIAWGIATSLPLLSFFYPAFSIGNAFICIWFSFRLINLFEAKYSAQNQNHSFIPSFFNSIKVLCCLFIAFFFLERNHIQSWVQPLAWILRIGFLLAIATSITYLFQLTLKNLTYALQALKLIAYKGLIQRYFGFFISAMWGVIASISFKLINENSAFFEKRVFDVMLALFIAFFSTAFLLRVAKDLETKILSTAFVQKKIGQKTKKLIPLTMSSLIVILVVLTTLYTPLFNEIIKDNHWILSFLTILFLALSCSYLSWIGAQKAIPILKKNKQLLTSQFIQVFFTPFICMVWVHATCSIAKLLPIESTHVFFNQSWRIAMGLLMLWLMVRCIKLIESELIKGNLTQVKMEKTSVQASGRLVRIIAVLIIMLVLLPTLGVPISGIIAFGGGSAIVAGIGAQQILANYFGGAIIYSDRHFRVGDWIHSPDRDIEGHVEYIGWRSTRIRTFDKRPLYVPNAVFSSIVVVNAQRMQNRRIKQVIGLRYEDATKLRQILKEIRLYLNGHDQIDHEKICMINFLDFGPSSLNLQIYTFTKTTNWKEYRLIQEEIFLDMIDIIAKHGAEIAFPTHTLHFNQEQISTKPTMA